MLLETAEVLRKALTVRTILITYYGSNLTHHQYKHQEFHQYKHQEFQFPLLDAVHCGTESEHQVSYGSLIGLFFLFILSPFTQILELSTK